MLVETVSEHITQAPPEAKPLPHSPEVAALSGEDNILTAVPAEEGSTHGEMNDVLPEIKSLAMQVGGMGKLAEIVKMLADMEK